MIFNLARYISIGFLVGVGLFFALQVGRFIDHIFITPYYQQEAEKSYPRSEKNQLQISSLKILSSRVIESNRNYSIAIKLKSTVNENIASAKILVSLFDTEGLFGHCGNWVNDLNAMDTKEVIVNCHDFNKRELPPETRYELEIKNVLRKESP